jgi:chromate transporter
LNLAVWFGLQVLFSELRPLGLLGGTLDVPVLGSANVAAIALAAACAVAVFRFRFGMIPVLLASSMAGIAYALML